MAFIIPYAPPPLGMWRRLLSVVLMIALVPLASAAETSGALRFPEGVRFEGDLSVHASVAFADLSPMVERGIAPSLAWGSATLTVVTATRMRWTENQLYLQDSDDSRIEPSTHGAGHLAALRCPGECKVFGFSREGDNVTWIVQGTVEGELRRVAQRIEYWSGYGIDDVDTFYHEVPAGWTNVSSEAVRPFDPTLLSSAALHARGDLGLVVWGAEATIAFADAESIISTGVFVNDTTGPGGVVLQRRTENRFLVLAMQNAALSSPDGAPFILHSDDPELSIEGALIAPEAHGQLLVDGKPRNLAGEALRIEGSLRTTLDLPVPLLSDLAAQDAGPHAAQGTIHGEATRIFIDGARIVNDPAVPSAIATGLTLAGIVLLALALLKLAGLLPFYTRITPETALRNDNRREIYDMLRASTGATIPELMQATGMAEAVVRHHLFVLERQRLIVERRQGRAKAYFPSDASPPPDLAAARLVLRDGSRRLVGRVVCNASIPITQAELSAATGLSQRLVSYHLGKLEKKGLVLGDGATPRRYQATHPLLAAIAEAAAAG